MSENAKKALTVFRNGGIVIFPTDTAFGIGCRIDDTAAVDRLFTIRNRPVTKATPILVSSIDMAKEYVSDVSPSALDLMARHWPGALTIVLPAAVGKIPEKVRGGGNSIGIRIPQYEELVEIIKALGVPILGPSANIHGENTPYSVDDLDRNLTKHVDFVLSGTCSLRSVSTVVDCTGETMTVIRQGAVTI